MTRSDDLPVFEALAGCGPLKAWSVVVTILGDLCEQPDNSITGSVLNLLVGRLGVSNQALRVALHRLRRDGWVRTEKTGRTSHHFLSRQGWKLTQATRPIIYAPDPPQKTPVWLVIAPPATALGEFTETMPDDSILIAPRMALTDTPAGNWPEEYLALQMQAGAIPDWVVNMVADPALRQDYARLVNPVTRVLDQPVPEAPVERMMLRLLILHHWRRLRLRHGSIPDLVLPGTWEGAEARECVAQALQQLGKPTISDLLEAADPAPARS